MTLQELADRITHNLQDKDVAEGLIDLHLTDMGHVHVDLASRMATASADNLQGPNSYVEISSDNLKKIRDGQLNPAMALMTRKIKVRGDLELVGKVAKLMKSS